MLFAVTRSHAHEDALTADSGTKNSQQRFECATRKSGASIEATYFGTARDGARRKHRSYHVLVLDMLGQTRPASTWAVLHVSHKETLEVPS